MSFTKEQREAVETSGSVPMVIDGIECVVLRADIHAKLKNVIDYNDSEMSPEEAYPAILAAWDAAGSPQDAEDYRL
jgi:hypothetical protein